MATTPEAAIHALWAATQGLQDVVAAARLHTGDAPEAMDTDAPRVQVIPGVETLVEQMAGAGRIVTHGLSLVVRSAREEDAKAKAAAVEAIVEAATLPIDGWMATYAVGSSTANEGDGIWAATLDLEIMQQK